MKAIWKDIPGFEGYYQVSNKGTVKSLNRMVKDPSSFNGRFIKGIARKTSLHPHGYNLINLCKGVVYHKTFKVSVLVMMAFKSFEPNGQTLVVDHINGDRGDDRLENLQAISQRENTLKGDLCKDTSSKYPGVYLHKQYNKWKANIRVLGKKVGLGTFFSEDLAGRVYKRALRELEMLEIIMSEELDNPNEEIREYLNTVKL